MSAEMESFFQFIFLLVIFIFVVGITYLTTRWIAKLQQGQISNRNIKVIETYKITTNKYIQIVKIANKCFVIAVCKDNVTFISEIDESELIENDLNNSIHFQEMLEKAKKLIQKK